MGQVLIAVVLLGLAASFSPVIIATATGLLTRPDPIPASTAFIGGVAAATAIAELLALALLLGLGDIVGVRDRPLLAGTVNLVLGAVTLRFANRMWRGKATEDSETRVDETASRVGYRTQFVLGFTLMIANVRAITIIIAAVNEVFAADVVNVLILLSVILLLFVVLLLPTIPLAIYFAAPDKAARLPEMTERVSARGKGLLAPVARPAAWLRHWARPATAVISALVGIFLILHGLSMIGGRLF
jgi:hypothetical protein